MSSQLPSDCLAIVSVEPGVMVPSILPSNSMVRVSLAPTEDGSLMAMVKLPGAAQLTVPGLKVMPLLAEELLMKK
ncbi:MAG: hypothetical protein ABSG37_08270 [Candidatus Limnocylindrales bacterium]